jgi:ATP-dependent helicase/DNAse subunit B
VLKARLAQHDVQTYELTRQVAEFLAKENDGALDQIGQVHCLLEAIPNELSSLLSVIADRSGNIFRYEMSQLTDKNINANPDLLLVSASDPQTEASIVARAALQKLADYDADRIAILYPDESQYLVQMQTELDLAGVAWHGKSRTVSQQSALSRTLDVLLESFSERNTDFSGLDRPRLMRLLENGQLKIDTVEINCDKIRKYVRRNDLYADAVKWLDVLSSLETLGEEEKEADVQAHLRLLVSTVEAELTLLSKCKTWADLGERLLKSVLRIHQDFQVMPDGSIEEIVWKDVQKVLTTEVKALDELSAKDPSLQLKVDPKNLLRLVRKRIGERRLRHGNLSTGVFVGNITESKFVQFDVVYVLGATEGLLPPSVNPDPFLPSRLLAEIGELSMATANRENLPDSLGRILGNALNGAKKTVILRPRSGTQVKLENEPSRYLPTSLHDDEAPESPHVVMANSFLASFELEIDGKLIGPVSLRDQRLVKATLNPVLDKVFEKSMAAWRDPSFNEYFGNLEKLAKTKKAWEVNTSIPLSSTRIDSFISCQYKFFAGSVLGFSDNDRRDSRDDFSATSFGVFFHEAMDRYIKDLASQNKVPSEGQAFPEGSSQIFIERYLTPNLMRFIATGRNGWDRSLQMHLATLLQTLPQFFAQEVSVLRGSPALAVVESEASFGKGAVYKDPNDSTKDVEWNLTVADADGVEHRLVGQADRLDASLDGTSVGVMDFKTGSRKRQVEKLGIGVRGQKSSVETLQDVIYKLAAEARYPNAESVKVNFVFVAEKGERMFLEAPYSDDPKNLLPTVLKQIKDSGITGTYSAKSDDYCKACSYLADVTDIVIRKNKPKKEKK